MKMKNLTLLILMVFALVAPQAVQAQDCPETWFEQANAAYNEGRYADAIELYDNVVKSDLESVALFYNMGNAYYKERNYPMAIYYYEKALKLDPTNEDAKVNLEIANLAIADKIEPIPQSFFAKTWNKVKNALSANAWAWLSVVCFFAFFLALFLFFRARRMVLRKLGFFLGGLMAVVLVFTVIFSVQKREEGRTLNHAIVMTPTVTVKSSPSASSVDLFVLHEGAKVTILDEADGWNKVRIANGSEGWLPVDASLAF